MEKSGIIKKYLKTMLLLLPTVSICACSAPSIPKEKVQAAENKRETTGAEFPAKAFLDLSGEFQGVNGCAVLYDPEENIFSVYNNDLAQEETSPYSTFKIVSALMGLHSGVIVDENSSMNYDGTVYPNPDWNGNLTLEEAFQTSCVWYFHRMINQIDREEVERELMALNYGNCDISQWEGSNTNPRKELNGFWLGSSLKISPFRQTDVLARIFEGESIYSKEEIEILRKIMLIQDDGAKRIYGKTGSSADGEAWFVGFTEREGKREYFAVFLSDHAQKSRVSGTLAKEIALTILSSGKLSDSIANPYMI